MTPSEADPAILGECFKSPYIESGGFAMEVHSPEVMEEHHAHGHIELNYLLGCQAVYRINGRDMAVPDGQLLLFWANMPHQMISANPAGKMLNVYIPLALFLDWPLNSPLMEHLLREQVVLAPDHLSPNDQKLLSWREDYLCADPRFRELVIQDLAILIKRLCLTGWSILTTQPEPQNHRGHGSTRSYKHIADIVQFISKHLHLPLSTKDVAEHIGLHRNYTVNLFKEVMGMSIKQYIQSQRLQVVQSLLIDTDKQVSEIAYASGFNSLGRFYDLFSGHYGMTPTQFRKSLNTQ